MSVSWILNPPRRRRKARKSARRGRRRNARGWFARKSAGSRVAYSHPSRKSNPSRRRRRKSRSRRRRNPGAAYLLNAPRRRRRKSRSRRRRNPGAAYFLNRPSRKRRSHARRGSSRRRRNPGLLSGGLGGLVSSVPQVIGFRVPLPGIFGKVANGIVQGGAAGAVVFSGYVAASYAVNFLDGKLRKADGTPVLTRFQKPILLAGMAGSIGAMTRFGAKFLKGNPALWFILGAAGPGLAAVASLLDLTINKEKAAAQGGLVYRIAKMATGLADYVQVGEELQEAGVGGTDDYIQTEDYIQTDGYQEAGVGSEEEVAEEYGI